MALQISFSLNILFPPFFLYIQDMTLNYTGAPFDFDLPALLTLQGGLIPILCQKQPHFIYVPSVSSAGTQDGKLDHPAGVIPKPFYGENVMQIGRASCRERV